MHFGGVIRSNQGFLETVGADPSSIQKIVGLRIGGNHELGPLFAAAMVALSPDRELDSSTGIDCADLRQPSSLVSGCCFRFALE